jgi:O-antigen ligase
MNGKLCFSRERAAYLTEVFFLWLLGLSACVSLAALNAGLGGLALFFLARLFTGRWKPDTAQKILIIFFAWNIISGLLTPLGPSAVEGATHFWSWTAFLTASALPERIRSQTKNFTSLLSISAAAAALMGLFEITTGFNWHDQRFSAGASFGGEPPMGFFSHHVTYGGVMGLAGLFLAGIALYAHQGERRRWIWLGGAMAAFIGLLVSLARGYFLGAAFASFILLWRKGLTWLLATVFTVTLFCGGILVFGPAAIRQRIVSSFDLTNPVVAERYYLWLAAIHTWEDHPIMGWGPGTYTRVAEPYKDPYRSKIHYPTFTGFMTTCHAHNHYLMLLIQSGVIGLLLFFLFIFSAIKGVLKNPDLGMRIGTLAALSAFLVGGFFDFNGGDALIATLIFFLLGLAMPATPLSRDSTKTVAASGGEQTAKSAGL